MGFAQFGGFSASFGNGGTFTVSFAAPILPCVRCGTLSNAHPYNDGQGGMLCLACGDAIVAAQRAAAEAQKRHAIAAKASTWISAAFEACAPMNRRKLYKALALAFHPDTGGDAAVMSIINDVKDRYRL